jgi:hypothetical protein
MKCSGGVYVGVIFFFFAIAALMVLINGDVDKDEREKVTQIMETAARNSGHKKYFSCFCNGLERKAMY